MIERILDLAGKRGFKQDALERAAGLSKGRVSKWKDGTGEPTATQLWRISRVLDAPLTYFLSDEPGDPPVPLSEAETQAVAIVRALRLDREAVIRRLSAEPTPPVPLDRRAVPDPLRSPEQPSAPARGRKRNSAG